MQLLQRNLAPWVEELLTASPVVVIEGARQVGKSTLASMLGTPGTVYASMDDDVARWQVREDPVGFLRMAGRGRLVIDEIQRCPELILPLKAEVDRDRRPGRFVLTGSANLLRIPRAEDSLAGRAMTARLQPFTQGELAGRQDDWVSWMLQRQRRPVVPAERSDIVERVVKGGYPPVQSMSPRLRVSWLRDYANRLVERDASDVGRAQPELLRRLLLQLAAMPGAELVLDRLAQELGVGRSAVSSHLELLERLFLMHRLPSWSRNLSQRQVQRPKCYLTDSGLAAALSGLDAGHLSSVQGGEHRGPLLEGFIACELLRQRGWSATHYEVFHYRDRNGSEVDLVIETPKGVIAVEVKSAVAPAGHHFKHLKALRDKLGGEFVAGVVLTVGEGRPVGDRLEALPVSSLWTHE